MLLSVIVPAYNAEDTLRACLDSFLPLTDADGVEVIVVDDGSRDSTRAIADEYCAKRPALFSAVSRENGGHGAAVNTGYRLARGEYIRIVDSDDAVNASELQKSLSVMRTARADVVLDAKEERDVSAGTCTRFPFPDGTVFGSSISAKDAWNDRYADYFMIHNMSISRELLDRNEITARERVYYDDFDYMLLAGYFAGTLAFSDAYVYRYSVGNPSQSTSAASMDRHYRDHVALVNACLAFFASHPAQRGEYLFERMVRLIRTHYTLSFLYGTDGSACRARGKMARKSVKNASCALLRATDSRYLTALILSFLPAEGKIRRKISSRKRG